MKKILTLLLGFSLILTSCKKDVTEPINKSFNVIDSLVVSGFVYKDSSVHEFNVQYISNITIDTLVLEDNFGNSTTLSKVNDTSFWSTNFLGVEGRTYTLTLMYNNKDYTDSDVITTQININDNTKADIKIEF